MSSANSPDWQMARLRRETISNLRKWAQRLDAYYARGANVEPPGEQGYSLDQIVSILLSRDNAHRERGRKRAAAKGPKELKVGPDVGLTC